MATNVFELIDRHRIAEETGVPASDVSLILDRYREVIDTLVATGGFVWVFGRIEGWPDMDELGAVAEAFVSSLADHIQIHGIDAPFPASERYGALFDSGELAQTHGEMMLADAGCDIDELLGGRPFFTHIDILFHVALMVADDPTITSRDPVYAVIDAAFHQADDHSERGVDWFVPVDRPSFEREFEDWLAENLHRLDKYGYPVRLAAVSDGDPMNGRQWITPSGRRADLVCRFTGDVEDFARASDWLVIELKVGGAHPANVEQVVGYCEELDELLDVSSQGLLITHGGPPEVAVIAAEHNIGWLSTVHVGWRGHRPPILTRDT